MACAGLSALFTSPKPPCLTGNSHCSSKPGNDFLFAGCGEQFPAFLAEFQKQGEGRSGTLLECTNATMPCCMPGTHWTCAAKRASTFLKHAEENQESCDIIVWQPQRLSCTFTTSCSATHCCQFCALVRLISPRVTIYFFSCFVPASCSVLWRSRKGINHEST